MTHYTEEQRTEALELYKQVGPAEAARQLGIKSATIRQWAARAGVTGDDPRTRLATEGAKTKWATRRADLADQAGAAAEMVLSAMVEAAEAGDGANARGLAVAFGVTVDKAQLLTGGATSRADLSTVEGRVAESIELADEVARQRAERAAREAG